jgi:C4-dicarboxylate transporter DctM subunit
MGLSHGLSIAKRQPGSGRKKGVSAEWHMCHPPVGLNLYVASGITQMGITELTVAVWPWLVSMLVFLILVTYVPVISTWLPRTLGMM